jgi:hypothetical protein
MVLDFLQKGSPMSSACTQPASENDGGVRAAATGVISYLVWNQHGIVQLGGLATSERL